MGAGTYSHHAYEAFRTLKATGEGKTQFKITNVDKLKWMCGKLTIENFKKRKERNIEPIFPKKTQKAIAGFSTEAVLGAIGNKLDPLVAVIAAGKIKGVVALANCSTLRNGPQDWVTINLTKELINFR